MTEDQATKTDLLKICNGDVVAAEIAFEWIYPSPSAVAASKALNAIAGLVEHWRTAKEK